jgi:hypothetical protein
MPEKRCCANPSCHKTYTLDSNKIDDGFCSFECWESVNCDAPEAAPVLEEAKEIFAYKS